MSIGLRVPRYTPDSMSASKKTKAQRPRTALWVCPRTESIASALIDAAELDLVALGADRIDTSTPLTVKASAAEADLLDEPRLDGRGCMNELDVIVRADPQLDPAAFHRENVSACSLEVEFIDGASLDQGQTSTLLGSFADSFGVQAAREALREFGPVAAAEVIMHSGAGEGSLLARLHDAFDALAVLCGNFDMVDAMLVAPEDAQSSAPALAHTDATPEHCSQLHGHLGILVRHAPRALATISASDCAPWRRRIRLRGEGGILTIAQTGICWVAADGTEVESALFPVESVQLAASQCAEQLHAMLALSPRATDAQRTALRRDQSRAACEAVRLSCRTRSPESPEKTSKRLSRRWT